MGQTNAASLRVALIREALTHVAAVPVSMVMGDHVLISMSAQRVSTTVIGKPCAIIHGDHTIAFVLEDITEMADNAKVSKSCRS